MKPEDHDKLWELLGKAEAPRVSPFFARNVLRAARQEPPRRKALLARVFGPLHRLAWPLALAGTCAIAAIITISPSISLRHHHVAKIKAQSNSTQIADGPDYQVINHLDELVADEESSLWLDDSTRDPLK